MAKLYELKTQIKASPPESHAQLNLVVILLIWEFYSRVLFKLNIRIIHLFAKSCLTDHPKPESLTTQQIMRYAFTGCD